MTKIKSDSGTKNNFIVTLRSTILTDESTVERVVKHALKGQDLIIQVVDVKRASETPK